jgi:putative transposase
MSEKYQNKYRIETTRATWWDYAGKGAYFITICTKNREWFFGEIRDGMMNYSEIGNIALLEWGKTPEIRPDMNIILDAFVVMPNHMHGIIVIGDDGGGGCRDAMHCVSTGKTAGKTANHFGPQSKNLGSVIRGYKSAVTTYARKNNIPFGWQSRFHDHIIRNEHEFQRIRNYILNNPRNWEMDSLK